MSRTRKDEIQNSYKRHSDAPYWRYGWAYNHGCFETRRIHNRIRRAKARQALLHGEDAPKEVRYLPWIWW